MIEYSFFEGGESDATIVNLLNERVEGAIAQILCDCADAGGVQSAKIILAQENYALLLNARNADGDTALICAAYNGQAAFVEYLLKFADLDVNAKGEDGVTALMHAIDQGHYSIAKMILQHPKADASIMDDDKDTAIILALESEQPDFEFISMLLQRDDVDVCALNNEKDSALSLAKKLKIPERDQILKLIRQHKSYVSELDEKPLKNAGEEVSARRRGRSKGSKNAPRADKREP